MFRAIKDYDGSDSEKCINLRVGDSLSAVHALDETWFIGYNSRTEETGAFPIECIEDCQDDDKLGSDAAPQESKPPKPMYANVSASIQKRKDSLDLNPMERSRTLSNKANKFDTTRLTGTKPEHKYRLKLVKKEFEPDEKENNASESQNGDGTRNAETNEEKEENAENIVSAPDIFTVKPSDDSKTSTLQRVRFSSVKLEHSVSIDESTASWQESSFEHSGTWSPQEDNDKDIMATVQNTETKVKTTDGKYHKFDKAKPKRHHFGVLRILKSDDEENKRLKAVFGAVAGLVIGGLLFVVLVFSFDYTELEAGIIVAISTIIMCLCLAFSTLCRCIMALVFPNFFTGKGRTVFLSIIFGVLLSHPVANITHNAKETGNSFSCMAELARNQTLALQRQLAQPIEDVFQYVHEQNRRLKVLAEDITGTFSTGSDQMNNAINDAQRGLNSVIQKCKSPMQELYNKCKFICDNLYFVGSEFLEKCREFESLGAACDTLNDLGTDINKVANDVKAVLTRVEQFFSVDVELNAKLSGESNTTKSIDLIQQQVNDDISGKAHRFEIFLAFLKKVLSLSLALLFFQSFWYLRNYLAKDDYDNIYITSQFKAFDRDSDLNGKPHVLPLKNKEKSIYVDPSSFRLNATELAYCKIGLAQILLHFILCFLLLMFDFALYYILNVVRKYGDVDLQVEGASHLEVTVNGDGPVALFYAVMVQGININSNFSASLEIGKCLPNPQTPSVSIIPVLVLLYIIALCFVLLRGYGMRLRRKIAAFYFPEQEIARLSYLHKKIRHRRIGLLKLIRQLIKSSHKETAVKEKLRLSTWLAFRIPFLGRFLTGKENLVCTSCEHSERGFNVKLTKCGGAIDGVACDAVYCQECWTTINHSCPLCTVDEEVVLRE